VRFVPVSWQGIDLKNLPRRVDPFALPRSSARTRPTRWRPFALATAVQRPSQTRSSAPGMAGLDAR